MPTYLAASRSAYQKSAVLTASQGQLIVMLYDGAHRFLFQAGVAMRNGNVELAHNKLRRAEAIIHHLIGSLDFEQGGSLAVNLHSIYGFCTRHLNTARIKQDADAIDQVDGLLARLRDAWAQVATLDAG